MIKCQNLTKRYGQLLAVDDLSFQVEPGEVLGFLGPNGAGKSTTMRIIAGFQPATSGSVTVCGFDVDSQSTAAKSRIGYLPEGAPSYPEMSPRSFLEFIADIRGMEGDPDVLILDEPTDGLDPNQKHEVRELIHQMSENKIIVISTHLLEEVDALCNRAIIIAHGKILADDTPKRLEARSRFSNAVSVRLTDPSQLEVVRSGIEALAEVGEIEVDVHADRLTAFPANGQLPLRPITELAQEKGWELAELHLESGRLDEVFRTITGGASA